MHWQSLTCFFTIIDLSFGAIHTIPWMNQFGLAGVKLPPAGHRPELHGICCTSWSCCLRWRQPTAKRGHPGDAEDRVSLHPKGERGSTVKKNTRYIQIQNDSNRKEYYKGFGPVSLIPRWPFSCCNMAQSPVDASSLFLAGRCDCLRIQPRTTGLLRRHDCTGISLCLCVPIMRTSLT